MHFNQKNCVLLSIRRLLCFLRQTFALTFQFVYFRAHTADINASLQVRESSRFVRWKFFHNQNSFTHTIWRRMEYESYHGDFWFLTYPLHVYIHNITSNTQQRADTYSVHTFTHSHGNVRHSIVDFGLMYHIHIWMWWYARRCIDEVLIFFFLYICLLILGLKSCA